MLYHIRILAGRLDSTAGSHVYHRELILRLASRGHRVSLVCFEAVPEVLTCTEVFEIPRRSHQESRFFWRFSSLLQYSDCARGLARSEISPADVVVGGEHLFLYNHWKMFPKTPWIYLPHSLVVDQEIRSYGFPPTMSWISCTLYGRLQRWALSQADCTLRFTHQACEALTMHYGRSARPRYIVNPMGIELPIFPEKKFACGQVNLLWVGQLIPRKRINLALTALAGLRQYDWRFDIVGDGLLRKSLEEKASELGLADRVQFHGFQSNPGRWYSQADLLLFPSWSENCPVTMLESMSYGVPCLAMRADGVRYYNANSEIINDGVDGFLADSDEDFKVKLERLLMHPETLTMAGEEARRTIASRHTWDQHLERYERIFDDLVDQKRGCRRRNRPLVTSTGGV